MADSGGCRENIARSCYVDADGKISPCVYLNVPDDGPTGQDSEARISQAESRRRVFGDVRCESAWEIWRKPDFRAFRENLTRNAPDAACLVCPKRFEC